MTITTPSAHPTFEHVALLHDGPDDLAARLAPDVLAAIDRREAVLVSFQRTEWEALADRLGRDADRVTYREAGVRYATPGGAMAQVHRFATTALAAGASTVWSIGSIPFEGNDEDVRWVRYEAAVEDVLGYLPCRLVCAYDTSRVADHLCAGAGHTHSAVDTNGHRRRSAQLAPLPLPSGSLFPPPRQPAEADAIVDNPMMARRIVTNVCGSRLAEDRLADAHVVASELVTNGLRHGRPPVRLRAWLMPTQLVMEVADGGPGLADPYPDLRPPRSAQQHGGYGLWIVGQFADWVDVVHDSGTTVVRAAIRS
jgi:anti-sigma regulatory factor (Ser/Thr protein kinase)